MSYCNTIEFDLARLEQDESFIEARSAIQPAFVPCDKADPAFMAYRRYSAELERYVERPNVMKAILREPLLKIAFFRAFGYRGELDFTVMPEVWMRDLPLLVIGRDVHLGYGMVLGTGQMSLDGRGLRLRPIAIGSRSFCNQHAVVEGGTLIGDDCLIGIRAIIGATCRLEDRVHVGDFTRIGADVVVGEGAVIGHNARIGDGAVIDAGCTVPEGGRVPANHRLTPAGLFPLLAAIAA